jgi:hypothetical protein
MRILDTSSKSLPRRHWVGLPSPIFTCFLTRRPQDLWGNQNSALPPSLPPHSSCLERRFCLPGCFTNKLAASPETRADLGVWRVSTETSKTRTVYGVLKSTLAGGGAWESNPPTNRKLPERLPAKASAETWFVGIDPDGKFDLQRLQEQQKDFFSTGAQTSRLDFTQIVDRIENGSSHASRRRT